MSLINEALKKAGREQHGTPTGMPAPSNGPTGAPAGSKGLVIALCFLATAVLLLAAASILARRNPADAPVASYDFRRAPEKASANTPPTQPVPMLAESLKAPEQSATLPEIGRTNAEAVLPPTSAPLATPPPAPPVTIEARIKTYVDSVRVTGVKISDSEAKCVMNNRVYRLGATVDKELGLKLVEITPEAITLSDESGKRFRKEISE